MIKLDSSGFINKDTWSVVFELLSNSNSASNRSTLIDFIHHCLFPFHLSELLDSVDFSTSLSPASTIWHTVFTLYNCTASNSIIVTIGLIRRASLISNVVVMNPFISILSITSSATIIRVFTWYQDLGRDHNVGPLSFSGDFDSVTKSRGRGESPTWAAVDRNMLVSLNCEIVCVVDISPPEVLGYILKLRELSEYFWFECFWRLVCSVGGDV